MLTKSPSATSVRPRRSTLQSLSVKAVGLRVGNPDKLRRETVLAGVSELPGKQASSSKGCCGQSSPLEDEAGYFIDALSTLEIRKNEWSCSSHASGVRFHDLKIGSHQGS